MVKRRRNKKPPCKVSKVTQTQILDLFKTGKLPEEIGKYLKVKITHVLQVITAKRRSPRLARLKLTKPSSATSGNASETLERRSFEVKPNCIYTSGIMYQDIHWIVLATGESRMVKLPQGNFTHHCCCTELPGGQLYFTGGGISIFKSRNVMSVAIKNDFANIEKPKMLTKRSSHSAVHYKGYLFVISGYAVGNYLKECEVFDLQTEKWDTLPSIPYPDILLSCIAYAPLNCLYAFGGSDLERKAVIQVMDFNKLSWRCMSVILPGIPSKIVSFVLDNDSSQIMVVQDNLLLSFNPVLEQFDTVMTLSASVSCSNGTFCYSKGVLYWPSNYNPPLSQCFIGL